MRHMSTRAKISKDVVPRFLEVLLQQGIFDANIWHIYYTVELRNAKYLARVISWQTRYELERMGHK